MSTSAFNSNDYFLKYNDSYCSYEQCSNDANKYPNIKLISQHNSEECYKKEMCNNKQNTTLLNEMKSKQLFTNSNIRQKDIRNEFDYSILNTVNLTIGVIMIISMIYYNIYIINE
jgi:hypothetical protein